MDNTIIILTSESLIFVIGLMMLFFGLNLKNWKGRLFNSFAVMHILAIVEAIADLIWFMIDGKAEFVEFNKILEMVYLVIFPFIGYAWLHYTTKVCGKESKALNIFKYIVLGLTIICAGLTIASYWTGWIFYIGEDNFYHRGDGFYIIALLMYFVLTISCVVAFVHGKKTPLTIEKKKYYTLGIVALPSIVFGVLQVGIGFLLPSDAVIIPTIHFGLLISMLILYMDGLDRQITIDYLTKINNRYVLDSALIDAIHRQQKGTSNLLWLVMMDLNDFKSINDHYGHLEGDEALKITANALKTVAGKYKTTVGRVGGDEFAIVLECEDAKFVSEIVTEIPKVLQEESKDKEYSLTLCYGVAIYEEGMDIKQLIDIADKRLYDNKAKLPRSIYKKPQK